jgi:acyl-coenzyme A synthetase/AMP-(fatty) acid ligase
LATSAKWFSAATLVSKLSGPASRRAYKTNGNRWGNPAPRVLTYQQLHREVCVFANILKRNRCKKGDRVLIYLPHIPEAAVAMLACARIGAVHSVVFGGFSSESIKDRLADSGASIVVTADGGYRRGQIITLKQNVDQALQGNKTVKRVIVFRRSNLDIHIQEGRDVWWHREADYVRRLSRGAHSEHPLFILYTAAPESPGVLHTTGDTCSGRSSIGLTSRRGPAGAPLMPAGSPATAMSSMDPGQRRFFQ